MFSAFAQNANFLDGTSTNSNSSAGKFIGKLPSVFTGALKLTSDSTRRKVSEQTICKQSLNLSAAPHTQTHFEIKFPHETLVNGIVPSSSLWPPNIQINHKIQVSKLFCQIAKLFRELFDFQIKLFHSGGLGKTMIGSPMDFPILVKL